MKKFKKAYVEITNICNLSCDFCKPTSRKPETMTVEQFCFIATEIKKHSDYIYLHIKGEPLLHKNLDEILKICKNLELKVCLTTNGTLIREKKDILIGNLHKLHISLHSFEANEINLSLDEYIDEICNLIIVSDFITVLRLWNDGGMKELNDKIYKKLQDKLNIEFEISQNIKINKMLYIEQGQKFEWPSIDGRAINRTGFCYALRNQIGVLVDGTVVPCCLDNNGDIPLGNIYNNTISEILEKEIAKNLYDSFSNRKLSQKLCTTCGFIQRF